ncbi:MAG: FixG Ig-like domain-containing protein, partial [Moraxellaceae bacterium]|nr:FixG Ig-like domain-containing protein [Moraxellaceae bacterium]
SVMFDSDTLTVTYDRSIGEPRGSRSKKTDYAAAGLGTCVDCSVCVQVCPTGIDIRDGLQFECIQCAACIDACDSVMDQMGYARGLVRYTTEHMLENPDSKFRFFRSRLIGYASVIAIMAIVFLVGLALRVPLEVESIRDRNQLYRENSEGMIENVYMLKIMNKSQQAQTYTVTLDTGSGHHAKEGEDGAAIKMNREHTLTLEAGEMYSLPVTLVADPGELTKTRYDVAFHVRSTTEPSQQKTTENRFLAPPPH